MSCHPKVARRPCQPRRPRPDLVPVPSKEAHAAFYTSGSQQRSRRQHHIDVAPHQSAGWRALCDQMNRQEHSVRIRMKWSWLDIRSRGSEAWPQPTVGPAFRHSCLARRTGFVPLAGSGLVVFGFSGGDLPVARNVEEYGIDLFGRLHEFPDAITVLNLPPDCPLPPAFFWQTFRCSGLARRPIAALLSQDHPLVGLTFAA